MSYSERLTITKKGSSFTESLRPPIILDRNKRYEVCLLSLNMFNDIPNVTVKNNKFKYTNDKDSNVWKTIEIPPGAYQFQEIVDKIKEEMIKNDDYDKDKNEFYIDILVIKPEQKSIISINNPKYGVKFDEDKSVGSILGFPTDATYIYLGGDKTVSIKSPNIINITPINMVLVNVSIIYGGYNNGKKLPIIYAFDPNIVDPGWKIMIEPYHLEYYKIKDEQIIDEIRISLTDEDGNLLDISNTEVTLRLEIREIL